MGRFIAILNCIWPIGCRLDTLGTCTKTGPRLGLTEEKGQAVSQIHSTSTHMKLANDMYTRMHIRYTETEYHVEAHLSTGRSIVKCTFTAPLT